MIASLLHLDESNEGDNSGPTVKQSATCAALNCQQKVLRKDYCYRHQICRMSLPIQMIAACHEAQILPQLIPIDIHGFLDAKRVLLSGRLSAGELP